MANRKPNQGPYVVSWRTYYGIACEAECQTWKQACDKMRELLIADNEEVSVRFV